MCCKGWWVHKEERATCGRIGSYRNRSVMSLSGVGGASEVEAVGRCRRDEEEKGKVLGGTCNMSDTLAYCSVSAGR